MLGPPKPRRLDEPIAVSLEDLVSQDHFYRHLEAMLDLGFVRDWVRELYAERGRPSIDRVVFFKTHRRQYPIGLTDLTGETIRVVDPTHPLYDLSLPQSRPSAERPGPDRSTTTPMSRPLFQQVPMPLRATTKA